MSNQPEHATRRAARSLSRKTKAVVLASALAGTGAWMAAAAGSASAAQTPPVLNSVSAGYAAGNIFGPVNKRTSNTWRFRYASATTRLPNPVAALNVQGDTIAKVDKDTSFAVHLANMKQTIVLGVYWNGSHTTPRWRVNVTQQYKRGGTGYNCRQPSAGDSVRNTNCSTGARFTNGNNFRPGVRVRLDLYYNQAQGSMNWYAYQNTRMVAHDTFAAWTPQSSGGGAFTEAFAGADFGLNVYHSAFSSFTRPKARTRLFTVTSVHFTSYNGTKGTVIGPWLYSQLQLGTSPRNVYANAPSLRNGGQDFNVVARH